MKAYIEPIKEEAIAATNGQVHIFHQLPAYPRKHLTVTLVGPWRQLLLTRETILRQIEDKKADGYRASQSHENFEMAVFFQQIRFAFKNLKRYILEKDIKFLSHWDIVSVFVDTLSRRSRLQVAPNASEQICEEYVDKRLQKRQDKEAEERIELPDPTDNPVQESLLDTLLGATQGQHTATLTPTPQPVTRAIII